LIPTGSSNKNNNMNILKRWKATTPKRYKKWGKIMKNISYSLGVGMAGVATL